MIPEFNLRSMLGAMLFLTCSVACPKVMAQVNAEPPVPDVNQHKKELKNAGKLIVEIVKEAEESLERYESWPEKTVGYAATKDFVIADKELMKRLSGRSDKRKSFDAFVKQRLLDFAPKITADDTASQLQWMKVVDRLPDFYDWPKPPVKQDGSQDSTHPAYMFTGTQQNVIKSITGDVAPNTVVYTPSTGTLTDGMLITAGEKGVKIQRSEVKKLRDAIGSFQRNLVIAQTSNQPIVGLRQQLYDQLPPFTAARMVLAAEDTYQRMKAGLPSYEDALVKFATEAAGYHDLGKKGVKESDRRKILAMAHRIKKFNKKFINEIKVSDGGVVQAKFLEVKADQIIIDQIIENLTPEKKP